jgi:hypothetical protein
MKRPLNAFREFLYRTSWRIDNFTLKRPPALFGGDTALFEEATRDVKVYGEYGCGKSTKWVMANTEAKIISVDSDPDWIDAMRRSNLEAERMTLIWADVGEVGAWGKPKNYSHRHAFNNYTEALWRGKDKPDVVLIDGRFRICCFLTTLKHADPGTKIIFDDYVRRTPFHVVEEFLEPEACSERQALFIVPPKSEIDDFKIDPEIERFRYVLD